MNPTRELPAVPPRYQPAADHYAPPPAWRPPARPPATVASSARGGGAGRALRVLLVTVLLILAPVLAGYVAFQLTTDHPLWPISIDY